MLRLTAGAAVVAVLAFAGGATAAGRWVISSINQIKPSVRHQLEGNPGPQGPQGLQGPAGSPASVGVTRSRDRARLYAHGALEAAMWVARL